MSIDSSTLESVTEFVLDGTHGSPTRTDEGVPVLSARNVKDGELSWETDRHTTDEEYAAFSRRLSPAPGDLLLTIVGTIGRAAVLTEEPPPVVFQRSVSVIRPKSGVLDPRYLYHVAQSQNFQRQLDRFTNRSSQAGVYLKKLKTAVIPLPPLAEQKRIAAILDAADALRAKRREVIERLDQLLRAAFQDMFGECGRPPISIGPPTFGRADDFVPLSEVARLATGHTPDRKEPEYWSGPVPWVSLTDIRDLDGTVAQSTGQSVTNLGIKKSSAVVLPAGTVCFSRTASVGFVTVMGREMATSQDFVNWVCGPDLDPIYLMWALRMARSYLLGKSSGSTHKTIYYRHAELFQAYCPDLRRQRRFTSLVNRVTEQERIGSQHAAELDVLFGSLQARAFAGELTA